MLKDMAHLLPDFPSLTEHKLSQVFRLIKCFVTTKSTGPDKIPVIVLKNLS